MTMMLRPTRKRIALLFCLVVVVGFASGCRTASEEPGDNLDQLPWNTPASWEGQIIGVPY